MNEKEVLKLISIKNTEIRELKSMLEKIKKEQEVQTNIDKENQQRDKSFNGLTAKEWTQFSRSVWNDLSSTRTLKHLDHGATFPKKLAERIIWMYSKIGDVIFDPFVGTGTTLYAARDSSRFGIGIELNAVFVDHIKSETFIDSDSITIIHGDCIEKVNDLVDESVQLTFTSPPYANLLHKVKEDREKRHKKSKIVLENNSTSKPYSENDKDFGNMTLDLFQENTTQLMKKIFDKTKKGGYNIWVVKDFRDTQNGIPYIDFHTIIANCGIKAGFSYHDLIVWDQNEQRSLVLLGYPSVFYVNQNHSFIVVLRKKNEK